MAIQPQGLKLKNNCDSYIKIESETHKADGSWDKKSIEAKGDAANTVAGAVAKQISGGTGCIDINPKHCVQGGTGHDHRKALPCKEKPSTSAASSASSGATTSAASSANHQGATSTTSGTGGGASTSASSAAGAGGAASATSAASPSGQTTAASSATNTTVESSSSAVANNGNSASSDAKVVNGVPEASATSVGNDGTSTTCEAKKAVTCVITNPDGTTRVLTTPAEEASKETTENKNATTIPKRDSGFFSSLTNKWAGYSEQQRVAKNPITSNKDFIDYAIKNFDKTVKQGGALESIWEHDLGTPKLHYFDMKRILDAFNQEQVKNGHVDKQINFNFFDIRDSIDLLTPYNTSASITNPLNNIFKTPANNDWDLGSYQGITLADLEARKAQYTSAP